MKILFVGQGRAGKLPFTEHLFREKLSEAKVSDVEVETAYMAELESPDGKNLEKSLKEKLLRGVDMVVVMEKWQKELLTRFVEYRYWDKIHLFADLCKKRMHAVIPSCDVDFGYRSKNEEASEGCVALVDSLKRILKGVTAKESPLIA